MSKILESFEKSSQKLSREYNAALSGTARTPIPYENVHVEDVETKRIFSAETGAWNGVIHRIETYDGLSVTSYSSILSFYMSGLAHSVMTEPVECICGTLVDKPIPSSIIIKNVKTGTLGKEPFFIPYLPSPIFNASEVYKGRQNWNPLLDTLNQDKGLRDLIGDLYGKKTIIGINKNYDVSRHTSWDCKIDDKDNNYETVCQIIPLQDKSLMATRHIIDKPKRIETAVKVISRIRKTIINYGYNQFSTGPISQPWANKILQYLQPTSSMQQPIQQSAPQIPAAPTYSPQSSYGIPQPEPKAATLHEAKQKIKRLEMGVGDVLGKAKATLKRMPETPTITEPTYGTRCNNCGREIQNDFRFCPYCQTILKPKYCGTCGRELKPDYVICPYCGRRVGQGNQ